MLLYRAQYAATLASVPALTQHDDQHFCYMQISICAMLLAGKMCTCWSLQRHGRDIQKNKEQKKKTKTARVKGVNLRHNANSNSTIDESDS